MSKGRSYREREGGEREREREGSIEMRERGRGRWIRVANIHSYQVTVKQ